MSIICWSLATGAFKKHSVLDKLDQLGNIQGLKVGFSYSLKSTISFEGWISLYSEGLEKGLQSKSCGKLTHLHLPFWKKIYKWYHYLVNWDLVLAGNSNVVKITKETWNYKETLPLQQVSKNLPQVSINVKAGFLYSLRSL